MWKVCRSNVHIGKQLLFAKNRNRVRGAVLGFSKDGAWTDLFENLSVNSLKRDRSNDANLTHLFSHWSIPLNIFIFLHWTQALMHHCTMHKWYNTDVNREIYGIVSNASHKMKTASQSTQRRHLWSSYDFGMVYMMKKLTWMHAAKSMSRPSCFLIFSHWSNQFGNL